MERFGNRLPNLEVILWVVASVIGFAVFLIVVPSFLGIPSGTSAQAARATLTPRPTLTRLPTGTALPLPPAAKERTPIPIPGVPSNAKVFAFASDPRRSGWFTKGDSEPNWGDRNLHAGSYKGQVFSSVVYFDLVGLAPGSRVRFAELELTGLSRTNLGSSGTWSINYYPAAFMSTWIGRPADEFRSAKMQGVVGSSVAPVDLAEGQINQFVFSESQFAWLEEAANTSGRVGLRIDGPSTVDQNLFTWDGGDRDTIAALRPTLRLIAVPADFTFITNTPTPQNVVTAAALGAQATAFVAQYGTATPLPRQYATIAPVIPVTVVPTPANAGTATAQAAYATAVAFTTGTFTPTPLNFATVTATPTNTPTPPFIGLNQTTPIPTATPRQEISILQYGKTPIPAESGLLGNILYYTNREGGPPQIWVMDGKGVPFAKLTGDDYYRTAAAHELYSRDGLFHLDVGRDELGYWMIPIFDITKGVFSPLIQEDRGAKGIGSYHPAWSPLGDKIAYVSERTGNSEIYVYDIASKVSTRLTTTVPDDRGYPAFNKRPTWSPDGKQIIYFSDRGAPYRRQIWIMNADGNGQRVFSPSLSDDWDPIWVKK